ncbi:aldehyde dehydrogenase family protein [Robertmurraya massiliosenegalensis]|uniref:aldehyde dehydrogenase family protein n=1 Tax=Robertmurraya TaxID=2837507 RepID=UPI0039A77560
MQTTTEKYQLFIDNTWVDSQSRGTFTSLDPATGDVLAEVPRGTKEDIDLAVAAARRAFESDEWQDILPAERGRYLFKIAEAIRAKKDTLAKLESLDTGKPLTQAYGDVEVAARYCEYYGGVADKILGETIPVRPEILDYTLREPLGVSGQIVPWNYPIQIAMRGIAPAIAAGNTVVVKPAEDTPMTAMELAKITLEIGLPAGVLNIVTGYGREAGAALANHPDVNQLTFTGSVPTGVTIMEAAAKNVVPLTLELGGKSPNIVFADANLEEASTWVVKSITQNAGQTCSAGARLVVEESIKDQFTKMVVEKMEKLTLGHGIDDPDIGPIVSKRQLETIQKYMEIAKEEGLSILTGGERVLEGDLANGNFFKPTVIDGVKQNNRLACEEVFGPVLSVLSFTTVDEAIQITNGTEYGLVAGVWTTNVNKAHYLAKKIRAGQIFINNYGAGGGVEMPFGGYRKSGFGREKGLETLRQYTQLKNIAVKISTDF